MTIVLGIILILIISGLFFLIPRVSVKVLSLLILGIAFCGTLTICVIQPIMHKPVAMSVIEYLVKVNKDGTMTTTKKTTTTNLGKTR